MLRNLIMADKIVKCPRCHQLARVRESTVWIDGCAKGFATCTNCVGSMDFDPFVNDRRDACVTGPLDFEFSCANLIVEVVGGSSSWRYRITDPEASAINQSVASPHPKMSKPEPKAEDMNTVWIARHKEAKNLILGVFTDQAAAKNEYDHLKQIELVAFDCKHTSPLGESFLVWIVSVGKDKAYRIISIFSVEKQAYKIASSVGGRVQATEAIPKRRKRRTVRVCKSWVVLGDAPERWTVVDEISVARKLFAGEEKSVFPIATFRRVYDRSLPHRIEILALTHDEAKYAARDFAELTDEVLCGMLEYNVDYKLIKADGKWGVDPCLLNQPV